MAKKTKKKITTRAFAKLAGVSEPAICKATKSGTVVKAGKNQIDPEHPANKNYIQLNQSKRKNHKLAAKVKRSGSVKAKSDKVKSKNPETDDSEVRNYASKLDLERAKLAVETKLKQVQLAENMKELIPVELVRARLASFSTVLQNTILILPDKLSDDIVNIVMDKGSEARADVATILGRALAHGIKESKKAIDKVTDYEM